MIESVNQLVDATEQQLIDYALRLSEVTEDLAGLNALQSIEGDPTRPGCVRRGIFQGIIYATGGAPGLGAAGDFPRIDLGNTNNVYLHFKLPLKITTNNRMFHLRFRGYCYGSAKIIDETVVGYCKASAGRTEGIATKGNFSPTVYVDSNNNVIVRMFFSSIYYSTMSIDSMMVSTGAESAMFNRGDLVARMSLASTVTF